MNESLKVTIKLKIFLIFIFFAQNTFAQKLIKSENKNDKIDIVFVPFFDKKTDEQFTFSLNQSRFKITDTTKVFKNLQNEFLKNTWFKSFLDGFDQNLKSEKNLFAGANENEIKDFKIGTLNSDVICIHTAIESKTVTKINNSGNVTLYCTIAVYDLESGELILKCKVKNETKFKDTLPDKNESIKTLNQDLLACFEQKLK
jgi:hypothetical protein